MQSKKLITILLLILVSMVFHQSQAFAEMENNLTINRKEAFIGNTVTVQMTGEIDEGEEALIIKPSGEELYLPVVEDYEAEESGFYFIHIPAEEVGTYSISKIGKKPIDLMEFEVYTSVTEHYGKNEYFLIDRQGNDEITANDFIDLFGKIKLLDANGEFEQYSVIVDGKDEIHVYNDGLSTTTDQSDLGSYGSGKYQIRLQGEHEIMDLQVQITGNLCNVDYAQLSGIEHQVLSSMDFVERLSGSNRYQTAITISQKTHKRANNVILVSGKSFPDALTAGALAYQINGPILFSDGKSIHPNSMNEIKRLEAKNIYIVGGNSVIHTSVDESLRKAGYIVKRIRGNNRYGTAIALSKALRESSHQHTAILANAHDFPDALSIAPYSAKNAYPILYTDHRQLNNETLKYLKAGGFNETILIGGFGSISEKAEKQLQQSGIKTKRINGKNRYETSLAIARQFYQKSDVAIFANGQDFPDALAGGVFAASLNAPIILSDSNALSKGAQQFILNNKISDIYLLGGKYSLSDNLFTTLSSFIKKEINKPEPKPEPKPELKPEIKPEVNPESRPDPNKKPDEKPKIVNNCLPPKPFKPHSPIRILLDPGHGEKDQRGFIGWTEGESNYYLSLELKKELEAYGFKVGMTRQSVKDNPGLKARGGMGSGYDLLLSIHSNATSSSGVRGSEIYDDVCTPNKPLAQAIVNSVSKTFGHRNRGVKYKWYNQTTKSNYYAVLRHSKAHYAMLMEHGFHTNPTDASKLRDKSFRMRLAKAEAKAIADYFGYTK
ncbi:MAG: cell wall-binding repeat-containing protein [Tissierellia bacterium]|nr:cell wall-binding repeat-containing protein [Tissierellia bacterium]